MHHPQIILIHKDKAILPELEAYHAFFTKKGFSVEIKTHEEVKGLRVSGSVLWYFMGFYLDTNSGDNILIHDYRSLSTGKLAYLKDKVKHYLLPKPDIRIFLNREISKELHFKDNTPSTILDMGVPGFISEIDKTKKKEFLAGYIGAVSKSRGIEKTINSFINNTKNEKLLLVGPVDNEIYKDYKSNRRIIFAGKIGHRETLEEIVKAEVGISFIPNKYPYKIQTPTKLLEYASLNMHILANPTPAITRLIRELKISNITITKSNIFPPNMRALANKSITFREPLVPTWEDVILKSHILEMIQSKFSEKYKYQK